MSEIQEKMVSDVSEPLGAAEIDQIRVLNTIIHHRMRVQRALKHIAQGLEMRALVHDESKLRSDEFEGFARINGIARQFPYGSEEYRASLRREQEVIRRHYRRNRHHPEWYQYLLPDYETGAPVYECGPNGLFGATLFDLIEMVSDWWSAWMVYDGQREPAKRSTWEENIAKQKERFSDALGNQWIVVEMVADEMGRLRETIDCDAEIRKAREAVEEDGTEERGEDGGLPTLASLGGVCPDATTEKSEDFIRKIRDEW